MSLFNKNDTEMSISVTFQNFTFKHPLHRVKPDRWNQTEVVQTQQSVEVTALLDRERWLFRARRERQDLPTLQIGRAHV